MCFATIFSQSVAWLFVLLTICFAEEFLIVKKSNLKIFFMNHGFGVLSRNTMEQLTIYIRNGQP